MKGSLMKFYKKIQERRVTAYYLSHLYVNQSYHSRILNYFLSRFLILIGACLLFILVSEGERIYASFVAGLSVLILYHLIVKVVEQKKIDNIIRQVREKVATEEFWRRISALDKDAFTLFLKDILDKLSGFSDVEVTTHLESEGINIICKYKDELVAIQCHLLDGADAVEPRAARKLSRAMSRRKYLRGFIISTTDFREDTKVFCNLIKEKRQIKLLGKNELLEMAKKANKFPTEEEVKNLILKKVEHKERIWRDAQKRIFAKPRIRPYFVYGTFLILLSMVIDLELRYLYYVCATILYGLGFIGIIFSLKVKQKVTSKWQDIIE